MNTSLCGKLDVMGESASSVMGSTVPYIGAEYIHPNSEMSALNSWLLDGFHVEIYLITDLLFVVYLLGEVEGRKEWFHGLENKGLTTASAKSRHERKNNIEEGPENV